MSDSIDRRTLIQAAGAGVVAGTVRVSQATPNTKQSGAATDDLIVRKIPKGEDVLPAIGFGTFITFDSSLVLGETTCLNTRRFWAAGGRVFDTSPLYGMAEVNVGQFASALGINDKNARLRERVRGRDLVGLLPKMGDLKPGRHPGASRDHTSRSSYGKRGGHARLPDAAMRKRMVSYMETIPGFATIGDMPWYPEKNYIGVIALTGLKRKGR
jgi:hypothetical protein